MPQRRGWYPITIHGGCDGVVGRHIHDVVLKMVESMVRVKHDGLGWWDKKGALGWKHVLMSVWLQVGVFGKNTRKEAWIKLHVKSSEEFSGLRKRE